MYNSSCNNVNLDFERTMVYTRKRPDELNYQKNDNNNVKKPLPIQFKTDKNNNNQLDPKFTINPITGKNLENKTDSYNHPINSYQNKKTSRSEMDNRISGYQNLPQTQAMPVVNLNNQNNIQYFSHIPLNTRLSNTDNTYSHYKS